jgi:hypothetical protein
MGQVINNKHAHRPKNLSQSSDGNKPYIKASTIPTITFALQQKFSVITHIEREDCIKN